MTDLYGREITYLRVSLTDRCNLRCRYCNPDGCSTPSEDAMSGDDVISIIKALIPLGIRKVRFTGGEPLLRKDLCEIVSRTADLSQIEDISLTTNATLLGGMAPRLKAAGLKRINISIDTLRKDRYRTITGGNIEGVWKGIEAAAEAGLYPIKLNTVLMGGINEDEIEDLVSLTLERDIDIRFIELMPMGSTAGWNHITFLPSSRILEVCPELSPSTALDASSPSVEYSLPGARGRVGLINPLSGKFCKKCNRIRLTSSGKLKLCLHSDEEIDLLTPLRKGEELTTIISQALLKKPGEHRMDRSTYTSRDMYKIGG